MSVIVMGESNIKHCYEKKTFDEALATETVYIQTSTKESMMINVEKATKFENVKVLHCSWLNEIRARCAGKEDGQERESELRVTIEGILEALFNVANEKPKWKITPII